MLGIGKPTMLFPHQKAAAKSYPAESGKDKTTIYEVSWSLVTSLLCTCRPAGFGVDCGQRKEGLWTE